MMYAPKCLDCNNLQHTGILLTHEISTWHFRTCQEVVFYILVLSLLVLTMIFTNFDNNG